MNEKVEEFLNGLRAGEPQAVEAANRLLGTMARLPPPRKDLTVRQNEVMELTACGWSHQEIALRMGVSRTTVDDHAAKARSALGARTRPHAVALWLATQSGSV